MEQRLSEAAIRGDIESLCKILEQDSLILDKVAAGCFNCTSPLHVAASNNQTQFVGELLRRKPELAEALDLQLRSALHLASAKGHDKVVEELVKVNAEMCFVRDREGKNPLHLAAAKGRINVLKELVRFCPQAVRDRVGRNETILHLCVKHNQWVSLEVLLEMVQGEELVNARDDDGNKILHLAVLDQQLEITSRVLSNQTVDVNAENASGDTAMDILIRVQAGSNKKDSCLKEDTQDLDPIAEKKKKDLDAIAQQKKNDLDRIEDLLREANAKRAKDLVRGHWLKKKKSSLMIVASLIATMAFQAGVSPPGGVWQDDSNGHRAGEAVMAYNYPDSYPFFLRFNTIGFVASLSTILLLISGLKFKNKAIMWILVVTMWLAITSMAITYAFANIVITPKAGRRPLTNTIVIAVIVWSSVMTLLLLKHTYHLVAIFLEEQRSRKNATKRIIQFKTIMAFKQQSSTNGWSILRKRRALGDGGRNRPIPVTTETKG